MPIGKFGHQAGFTYVGLLIAVVFVGLGAVGWARLLASADRADREAELLFVGRQFRQAIQSYVKAGPGQYPSTLEDLVRDPRTPAIRRHLRRVFVDPITNKAEWGLVAAPEGGIMGVYSLSPRTPMKRANVDPDVTLPAAIQGASSPEAVTQPATEYSYQDWKFIYRPS